MKGDRARKVQAEEYYEGLYVIRRSISGLWFVVDGAIQLNQMYETLHQARQWCKAHPADPDIEGKHNE